MKINHLDQDLANQDKLRRKRHKRYLKEHPEYSVMKKDRYKYNKRHLELGRTRLRELYQRITPEIIGSQVHQDILYEYEKVLRLENYIMDRLRLTITIQPELVGRKIDMDIKKYLMGNLKFLLR